MLWVLVLAVVAISNLVGPEKWLPGQVNLYIPQWIYALPALLILPAYLITARRWVWLPLLALLLVAGPLMGFTCSFPADISGVPHVRIMTFNVKFGWSGQQLIANEIVRSKPDIVQLQDATSAMTEPASPLGHALAGYQLRVSSNPRLCVASKYPISQLDDLYLDPDVPDPVATRAWVKVGHHGFALYNAHLLTPRFGLLSLRRSNTEEMEEGSERRITVARQLAERIRLDHSPVVVTGDFNAPLQSLACRHLTDIGLVDAFRAAGRGYGYTYGQATPVHAPYVTLDHIFVSRQLHVTECHVGGRNASAHSPVRATVAFPR